MHTVHTVAHDTASVHITFTWFLDVLYTVYVYMSVNIVVPALPGCWSYNIHECDLCVLVGIY